MNSDVVSTNVQELKQSRRESSNCTINLYKAVKISYGKCQCGTPLISDGERITGMCTECFMDLPEYERKAVLARMAALCKTS
jgi:hypothetical protein